MQDDNGNGKQRQINGLKNEDRIINVKLDLLQSSIEDVHRILTDFIAPGGVCVKHRLLTAGFIRQVTVQWWFIGGIVMGLIGLGFAVLKNAMAGG